MLVVYLNNFVEDTELHNFLLIPAQLAIEQGTQI